MCIALCGRRLRVAKKLTDDGQAKTGTGTHRSMSLASLCRRAGISQPEVLADTLTLLLEGARVSRQAAGSKGPSAKFTATAEAVIATFQSRTKVSPKSAVRKRTK